MRFSEMAQAIKAVLHALDKLHEMKFCHCDVRWPNVIFDVRNNMFVLIDFEYARPVESELPSIKTAFIPEGLRKQGKWNTSGDVYQVVQMIQRWAAFHDVNFSHIRRDSLHKQAKDLLGHLESLRDDWQSK